MCYVRDGEQFAVIANLRRTGFRRNMSAFGPIYLLAFGLVLGGTNVNGDDFETCVEMFKPENIEKKCCESMNGLTGIWDECKSDSYDCKAAACVLKKMGILKDDKIDEDTAKAMMEKWGKDHPNEKAMTDRVKQFCLDSQYEDYGIAEDTCGPIKFQICAYINSIVECSQWKDTDACKTVEGLSKDCKKAIDAAK